MEVVEDGGPYTGETEPFRDVHANGDKDFSRRLIAREIVHGNAVALVMVRSDGAVTSWSAFEDSSRFEWLSRRFADGLNLIRNKVSARDDE